MQRRPNLVNSLKDDKELKNLMCQSNKLIMIEPSAFGTITRQESIILW